MAITHAKVSAIADDPAAVAAGEVVPSDWNAGHVIGSDIPRSVSVELSAAQVATINSAPVQIVPAPGVGKFVFVIDAVASLNVGASPFTGVPGQIVLKYPSLDIATIDGMSLTDVDNTIEPFTFVLPAPGAFDDRENDRIEVTTSAANPAPGGDSTLRVTAVYVVVDL